ncbi:Kelch-like protein 12 [Sparganum proliferum]
MAVVMFAKMMKLSNLENWGVQFMANRVNLENLATTWDFARSSNMGSLMETCINLMQAQFTSFVSTDLFLRLPADTVLTLLRNDNLSVDSEEAVFEAISSWVAAGDKECDNERLRLHAPEMLKEVRWCQTTLQFRSRLLNSHPMFRDSTSCARFLGLVEQWMTYADKNKPPCPFNRRRRPPQAIFFVFGKDEDQDRWSVLRFDPQLEKEERISNMEKREYATYSPVGESIFVVGGDTAQQEDSTSVEEFLVAERRWRKRASLAVGRSCHAAAVLTKATGEALIGVFGGCRNGERLSSCEVYEVSRDRWFKLPDLREKRNATAAACLSGDSRVFVFGGSNGPSSPLASVEFCQLRADWRERATSSDFWQPAAPMRTARSRLAATHFRGKIIVAGGYDGKKDLDVVEMFTPPDARCPRGQWTELAGMKEPRAFYALLTSTDDAVFALGCWRESGNTVETFTAPGGSADVSNDLTAWSWSSKKPLETLEDVAGVASIRITQTAPALVSPSISPAPPTTSTNLDRPTEPPLPSSSFSSSSSSSSSSSPSSSSPSSSSSSTSSTTAAAADVVRDSTTHISDKTTDITPTKSEYEFEDSDFTCNMSTMSTGILDAN